MQSIIRTLAAVWHDLTSYFWPLSRRNNLIRSVLFVAAVIAVFVFLQSPAPEAESDVEDRLPQVTTATVREYASGASNSFIGTVRSVSEAEIQSEVGGRITSLTVRPGDNVAAGAIIATLENASQRAAVLQAEGSYESALAAAAQSDVSVTTAESNLQNAQRSAQNIYQSAYSTTNSVVLSSIDQFFRNPQSLPSLYIATGNNQQVIQNRVALNDMLAEWQQSSTGITTNSDVVSAIEEKRTVVVTVLNLVDVLIATIGNEPLEDTLNGKTYGAYLNDLNSARSSLVSVLNSLDTAVNQIISAQEALTQAQLSGTGNTVSAADAQVKSALGALRAAQAQLAKTILRTPISGTVNIVHVNQGDFVGAFTPIAEIANNNAKEVSIFLGEQDLATLTVGDAVIIAESTPGVVQNISPAVDPNTLKTEVIVTTESTVLTNGTTVNVTASSTPNVVADNTPLVIPLTAVKFTATDGTVFTVVDGVLEAQAVTIGAVHGNNIEILDGLDADTAFVVDARGLQAGTEVAVRANNS